MGNLSDGELESIGVGDLLLFKCGWAEVVNAVYKHEESIEIDIAGYSLMRWDFKKNGQFQWADPHPLDIVRIYKSSASVTGLKKELSTLAARALEVCK